MHVEASGAPSMGRASWRMESNTVLKVFETAQKGGRSISIALVLAGHSLCKR